MFPGQKAFIRDVTGWDPGTVLRAIPLPVHQILHSTQHRARVQQPVNSEGWLASDVSGGGGDFGGRDKGLERANVLGGKPRGLHPQWDNKTL